MTGFFRNR